MNHLPSSSSTPDLLTVAQVAALLQVGVRTVRRHVAAGQLPEPICVGKRTQRWDRAQLMAWLKAGGISAHRPG